MVSFFGVGDYNYDNKYFFQGSVRADGSSLFGAANRWVIKEAAPKADAEALKKKLEELGAKVTLK